ncbi:hypothetical protein [Moorena producens]|uniref:hypothetical protein n=1 Tax=Moorena producens TaxID=1155739 RepID=UPI0011EA6D1E|nr:hypothetical protein [Moorena producens]
MILSAPVEWASWWNWHLASFNIFSCGQDGQYFPAARMPTLLLFIQRLTQRPLYYIDSNPCRNFDNFSSLLPTPYSLFPLLYKVP